MTATGASSVSTIWPQGVSPDGAAIVKFAVREADAPAQVAFDWLRRIDQHPKFYPAMRFTKHQKGSWPQAGDGTAFSFMVGATFVPGVKITFLDESSLSLAWTGGAPGLFVCHAWTIKDLPGGRSAIRSEEIWDGPIAKLMKPLAGGQIQKVQTEWAKAVAAAASQHPQGPPAA